MCMCVRICVLVYVHVCLYMSMCTCLYVCACVTCLYVCACVYVSQCTDQGPNIVAESITVAASSFRSHVEISIFFFFGGECRGEPPRFLPTREYVFQLDDFVSSQ